MDQYVSVPPAPELNITGDVTVCLWAKRTVFGDTRVRLINQGGGSIDGVDVPKAYGLFFGSSEFPPYDAGNFATVDFEDEGGEHEYLVSSTPTDGEFHHHAFVRQGNTQTLFFDGEIVASASFTRTVGDTTDLPLVIGNIYQVPETGDFAFGGIIDEVQVYNRALSDSEVQRIFDADDPDAVHQVTVRATFKAGERTASVNVEVAGD